MLPVKLRDSGLCFFQFVSVANAKSLWSSQPATSGTGDNYILKTGYPVGNGRLGGVQFGPPGSEKIVLNVDSLWSGGPFESSDYSGGNPSSSKAGFLPGIRSKIFQQGTGDVTDLLGSNAHYGTYRTLANIDIDINHGSAYTDYRRTLNLETSLHTTTYTANGVDYMTSLFCSNPADVCVYRVNATGDLPQIGVRFENSAVSTDLAKATCGEKYAKYAGVTQTGPPEGLQYAAIARVAGDAQTQCDGGSLAIPPATGVRDLTLIIGAGTNYDSTKGNPQCNYSFRGEDPSSSVESQTSKAASSGYDELASDHTRDYRSLFGAFTLDLPDPKSSAGNETSNILSEYSASGGGNPFVESLLFDLSRYLLISSSRENSLPATLQGRWTEQMNPSWSSDYHANINLQMNYWAADQTGLSRTSAALWNYIKNTWVPRGTETAQLLYNATGWVTHNEMNIFGHTAMKDGAEWGDYPAAAAWMMQHVWDNFEYGRDLNWLREEGYPLIKGVAQFWLSQLQDDAYTGDGSLVVNPCNSPEHGPTTFGCTHFQQLIHQVFEATLNSISYIGDNDQDFRNQVVAQLGLLDKGLHFTSWGGVKEWKLPDSQGYDDENTHRHLSNLVGWFPGYSISSFQNGYTNETIQRAVAATLDARGTGTEDSNTGWGKVWRAACWARLNNTDKAYSELQLVISTNFARNGLDMYSGSSPPFQIDANFGLGGAILSMLVVDLPSPYTVESQTRTVVLGPAIPSSWGGGSVKNLRLRGGRAVDFSWNADGKVKSATLHDDGKDVRLVNVDGVALNGM